MNYMDTYRKLQPFRTVKDFDWHRSSVFYTIKDKLSKGALAVWNVLARHSCEVPGVCWLKIDTIAAIAQVSRSTVERSIRLFKKLGVLSVQETVRPTRGGDGANVYIFQKLGEGAEMTGRSDSEKPCDSKDEPAKTEKKAKTSLNLNKYISKERTAKPAWIPDTFYKLLDSHISSVDEIEEYWRSTYATTYKYNLPADVVEEIGIQAFMTMKTKRKKLRKPIAFYTGVVKKKAKTRYLTSLFNDVMGVGV